MTTGAVGETRPKGRRALPQPSREALAARLSTIDAAVVSSGPGPASVVLPGGEDILDAVLDAVTVGVVVQHRDGTPLLANHAARGLLDAVPAPLGARVPAPRAPEPQRPSGPLAGQSF